MIKLVTYAGYDNKFGPHIFPIEPDLDRSISHIKMARELPPQIESYMRSAAPEAGKTQLLIDAMGSSDYYGSNVNGDYFPTESLDHKGPDYGYETFMHYGYPYKFHVNKDPAKAYGDKVTLADYDRGMHRVLLIIKVDDRRCQDILGDLAANRYWDVSMGCFIAGSPVTMADGTRKPIEQVIVGDEVITHRGRARRVTQTHRRAYQGEIYSIRAEASRTIRCTRQHPFLAVSHDDVKTAPANDNSRTWRTAFLRKPEWTHAECLTDDTHVLTPIPQSPVDSGRGGSIAMARILGYYLAEGHILRNKKKEPFGIELTTHRDDAIHSEIADLCEQLKTDNEPAWFQRTNSEFALGISIFDKEIARLCLDGAGQYSKEKRLSREVMEWDLDAIRNLIGAYANGDGCAPSDGSLKMSTASEHLAWQLQYLLLRLDIPASVASLKHGPSPLVDKDTVEWVVHIGKQWAQSLRPFCSKIGHVEVFKTKNSRKIIDGYLVSPIREIDAMYVETEVFNFEVEEDGSYLVEGIAVHNCRVPQDFCSICGNAARNRGEYCSHLRYQMNKILPDGRRVCAINRKPKFFDISFVPIGAEKASHVLKKVAHEMPYNLDTRSSAELGELFYPELAHAVKKATEHKSADINKEVPVSDAKVDGATPEDRAKMDGFMADAGKVKAQEPAIPTPVLDALGSFPLKNVFATLAALGIDLRPQEFQRIILIKQGAKALAEKLAQHRLVFDETRPAARAPVWSNEFAQIGIADVSEKIAMLLQPYLSDRSCYPEILAARLARMEKRADFSDPVGYDRDSQWYPMTDEGKRLSSGVPGLVPASIALAAGFLVFRKAFPQIVERTPQPLRTLASQPWLLPILIGAGVGASVGLNGMTGPRPMNGTGGGLDGKTAAVYHQPKIAGIDPIHIGFVPLAYIHSGVQQQMTRSDLTKQASLSNLGATDASIIAAVHRLAHRKKETSCPR